MEDDYEITRRRQAEERRRQREEERKKRREMLGLSRFRDFASNVSDTKNENENNSNSSPILLPRKRSRTDLGRIEKLKEDKRAEEGLRLIQEMYGTSYLNADTLLDCPPTERCEVTQKKSKSNKNSRGECVPSSFVSCKQVETLNRTSSIADKFRTADDDDDSDEQKKTSQTNQKNDGKLLTSSNNYEDSSSDEDIVELARILQEKKRSRSLPVRKIASSKDESKEECSYNKDQNGDSDEDQSSCVRIRKRGKISSGNHRELLDAPIENSVTESTKYASFEKEYQDSASEEDLFAYSRRLQKMQKKMCQSYDAEISSLDDDDMDDNLAIQKGRDKPDISKRSRLKKNVFLNNGDYRNHKKIDDELWDDSDKELDQTIKQSRKENDEMVRDNAESRERKSLRKNINRRALSDVEDIEDGNDFEQRLKPEFDNPKWIGDFEPFVLNTPTENSEDRKLAQVPASINRYLKDYQKEGVRFLYSAVNQGLGAILGDDMGLGKTVQLISLVAALQDKTGTGLDLKQIQQRYKRIEKVLEQRKIDRDTALLEGGVVSDQVSTDVRLYSPILVIVPPSVISNWENEFKTWGHFAVASYRDSNRTQALQRVKVGMEDILLCGKSMLSQKEFFPPLLNVTWKLIVVDEYHDYKNPNAVSHKALAKLRNASMCPLIGMTGTLMSNTHKELFNLIDLVQPGLLGSWKEFTREFSRPIMLSRTKDAKPDILQLGERRSEELNKILSHVYLRRDKSICLEDDLPTKNQKIIFCPLSDVQKALYHHIINDLPEYDMLRKSATPCDCGVNKNFFINYRRLPTKGQKLEYYRRHKKDIVQRKDCCYKIPSGDKVVLWPSQHPSGKACPNCPTCILLPALTKLYKLCSHASLLQADCHPDFAESDKTKEKAQKDLAFAKVAIPKDILPILPGKSFVRQSCSILDDHIRLSGKMKILDFCLKKFERRRDRVLLFSYSTVTLDLIQQFLIERGYSYLRLDGTTPTSKRQTLIDEFQQNNDIFVFLISTKAGGMGLNLTAANRVIIYDVNWSPTLDEQAQDRSYRIGQERDVDVVRLVASGTIEELMYMRQVYKVHLKKQTLKSDDYSAVQPARIFRGVDKDKNRKGELFGLENLLKFTEGSFMEEMWKANSVKPKTTDGMHTERALAETFAGVTEEQIENGFSNDDSSSDVIDSNRNYDFDTGKIELKSFNHDDFLRSDKGDAKLKEGDEGYDEEMGAASQLVQMACEAVGDSNLVPSGHRMTEFGEDIEAALISNLKKSVGLETLDTRATLTTVENFARMRAINEVNNNSHAGQSSLVAQSIAKCDSDNALFGLTESKKSSLKSTTVVKMKNEKTPKDIQPCSTRSKMKLNSGVPDESSRVNAKDHLAFRGAKESIPSFSARRMLHAPSYLKQKK